MHAEPRWRQLTLARINHYADTAKGHQANPTQKLNAPSQTTPPASAPATRPTPNSCDLFQSSNYLDGRGRKFKILPAPGSQLGKPATFRGLRCPLGDFVLSKTLAHGRHAKFRLAMHVETGNFLAVRDFRITGKPFWSGKTAPVPRADLLQEASVARGIDSPVAPLAIVDVTSQVLSHDFKPADKAPKKVIFVLSQLMTGDLQHEIDALKNPCNAVTPTQRVLVARSVLIDVATDLFELHAARLVHRDVKPANVLLDEGRAVLADFGLTAPVGHLTLPDGPLGYCAPEAYAAWRPCTALDVWSLALLYAEIITTLPFPRSLWKRAQALPRYQEWYELYLQWQSQAQRPNPLNTPYPEYDRFFATLQQADPTASALIFRMLAPQPEKRPNIEEVLQELMQEPLLLTTADLEQARAILAAFVPPDAYLRAKEELKAHRGQTAPFAGEQKAYEEAQERAEKIFRNLEGFT